MYRFESILLKIKKYLCEVKTILSKLKNKRLKKHAKIVIVLLITNLMLFTLLVPATVKNQKLSRVNKENIKLNKDIASLNLKNESLEEEIKIMELEKEQPNRAYAERVKLVLKKENLNNCLILQTDERWKDISYGWGDIPTLEMNGCAIVALTMIDEIILGKEESPEKISDWAKNKYFTDNGTSWNIYKDFAKHRGYKYKNLGNDIEKAIPYLKKNIPVVVSAHSGYFTTIGHALVLTHFNEKGIRLLDPSDNQQKKHALKYYSKDMLKKELDNYWVFEGTSKNF